MAVKSKFLALILLNLCFAGAVYADGLPVNVSAQCRDFGFSYYEYKFNLDYLNPAIALDSRVELIRGFAGHGSINSGPFRESITWEDSKTEAIGVLAAGRARSEFKQYYMATGGYLSDLDFAFRITQADGSVIWDTGTSSSSDWNAHHYRAHFFTLGEFECFALEESRSLPVKVSL